MFIAGPLPSALNVQYLLVPTDMEMVEAEVTSAHAKTASTGYSLLRIAVDEPPVQMVALG